MSPLRLLPALLLASATVAFAPTATAQVVSEDCTVAITFWTYGASCTGTFNGGAYFVSCPNHPTIYCLDSHILTCAFGTSLPWWCVFL